MVFDALVMQKEDGFGDSCFLILSLFASVHCFKGRKIQIFKSTITFEQKNRIQFRLDQTTHYKAKKIQKYF